MAQGICHSRLGQIMATRPSASQGVVEAREQGGNSALVGLGASEGLDYCLLLLLSF